MKNHLWMQSLLVGVLSLTTVPAFAQNIGFDASQNTGPVSINTRSVSAPTVLNTVTVTCPAAGYLVATASTLFTFHVESLYLDSRGPVIAGRLAYSLTADSTSFQASHQHNVSGDYPVGFFALPATMQRVGACAAGQSVTHRFLATRGSLSNNNYPLTAVQPRLVVVFYRDKL
jgi:hypothetical protein